MRLGKSTKIDLIKGVPLFSKLSRKGLEAVATVADEMDLPAGKTLTKEGERGREFFVLLEGTADVHQEGRKIRTLGKGDFLGEIALVTKLPRTATVTTTSPARALVITERDFASLLQRSPQIGQGVLEALGERLAPHLRLGPTGLTSRVSTGRFRRATGQARRADGRRRRLGA